MVGRALDRKLARELWRLRAQVMAIALIVASGVALLVMSLTTVESLEATTAAYYERYRFADVFGQLKRAPARMANQIAAIPGVQTVETRISALATVDVAGFEEPVIGRFLSLPDDGQARLNRLVRREGRDLSGAGSDEVVVSEPFAQAHGLVVGDRIGAVLNGQRRDLTIVGTALSPEFVYAIAPGGLMPDDDRFGVFWMSRSAMAAAWDMEGAFNEVSATLLRETRPEAVIEAVDRLLAPYGGLGAYARKDQLSNWFLQSEIDQQRNMAAVLPMIFLGVAAFLTYMVMARLIATQRGAIGLLKAFGYGNGAVAWHYARMILVTTLIGIALGFAAGSWLGHYSTGIYARFYHFPFLFYRPQAESYALAAMVSLATSLAGGLWAVRRAALLPPAEAMRPPAPPGFHRSALARMRLLGLLDGSTRMIARRLLRWPLRSVAAAGGIGFALAVLLLALQWVDAIALMERAFFEKAQHQDATVGLVDLRPDTIVGDFANLPGVLAVEPYRAVAARIVSGHTSRRQAILGVPQGARLSIIRDNLRGPLDPPVSGLLLSATLAELLGVVPGDTVEVEVLEGRRPHVTMTVAGTVDAYVDMPVYMEIGALNRLMQEGAAVNGVQLAIDPAAHGALLARLKDLPAVAAVSFRQAAIATFHATLAETIFIYVGFFVVFACTLAFGVTYSILQVSLSERQHELATLRVLGFGRLEITYILLGETALLALAAIPLGIALGFALAWYLARAFETELYRLPVVIEGASIGTATLIVLGTAAACGILVRGKLDRLDLVAALKTRE